MYVPVFRDYFQSLNLYHLKTKNSKLRKMVIKAAPALLHISWINNMTVYFQYLCSGGPSLLQRLYDKTIAMKGDKVNIILM